MGNTIGAVLISYDINRLHTDVKDRMKNLGYLENWYYPNQITYYMPNTTLWHKSKTSDAALSDLENVCYQLGVTLDKAVAVLAKEFAGV